MKLDELRQQRARDAQELQRRDLLELLQRPAFRRYLERLVATTRYLGSTLGPKPEGDAIDGMREVGRMVLAEIRDVDPGALKAMVGQHLERLEVERDQDEAALKQDTPT